MKSNNKDCNWAAGTEEELNSKVNEEAIERLNELFADDEDGRHVEGESTFIQRDQSEAKRHHDYFFGSQVNSHNLQKLVAALV